MRALLLVVSITAHAALVVPTSAGADCVDAILFRFAGHDYQTDSVGGPDPTPDTLLTLGDYYESVGFLTSFGDSPLAALADPSTQQYTYFLSGLRVRSVNSFLGFLSVVFEDGGRLGVYSDDLPSLGGTNGEFGTDPRNATVPSSFTDADGSGTLVLGARVDGLVFSFNFNTLRGTWFGGNLTMDDGAWLGQLPAAWRTGLSAGADLDRHGTMPAGYETSAFGCVGVFGLPTVRTTWGGIKQQYR